MKTLLIILVFLSSKVCSQPVNTHTDRFINKISSNIDTIKLQTIYIMKMLGIAVRKNIAKDDPISFTTYNSPEIGASFSHKGLLPSQVSQKFVDTNERYYIKPTITLSSSLDSILSDRKLPFHFFKIDAIGILVHELTHYYQNTFTEGYIEVKAGVNLQYAEQPVELEAFGAYAYYFLYFVDRIGLNKIMKLNVEQKERIKILYNSAYHIFQRNVSEMHLK